MSCPEIANACCYRLWRERLPCSTLSHAPRILCITPGATQVTREEANEDGWDPHKGPLALNRAIDLHHVHSHLPPLFLRDLCWCAASKRKILVRRAVFMRLSLCMVDIPTNLWG